MSAPAVPMPRFAQIEPVGHCNLRCRMCPIQFRGEGTDAVMAFDDFCRLLDQLEGLEELHLQGLGEPLLHPRFFDMVRYASARGVRVSTNTNMTVMTAAQAQDCVASGLHAMAVSLDGASAQVYQAIRVGARLHKVLRNLRRLLAAREAAGSALPQLSLVAVVMRHNLLELPALVRLAHAEGVPSVSVQHLCHDFAEASLPRRYLPMRAFVDAQSLLGEAPQRVALAFEAARAEARRLGVALRLPQLVPRHHAPDVPGPERCDWPWRGPYISYDGSAMPCCMVSTPDRIQLGDMSGQGVAEVWNNAAYRDFRARLSSPVPPAVCSSCALYRGTF